MDFSTKKLNKCLTTRGVWCTITLCSKPLFLNQRKTSDQTIPTASNYVSAFGLRPDGYAVNHSSSIVNCQRCFLKFAGVVWSEVFLSPGWPTGQADDKWVRRIPADNGLWKLNSGNPDRTASDRSIPHKHPLLYARACWNWRNGMPEPQGRDRMGCRNAYQHNRP